MKPKTLYIGFAKTRKHINIEADFSVKSTCNLECIRQVNL